MLLLRALGPWLLLLAVLGQQVSGARSKNRGADKDATSAPGRAQRSGDKTAATGRGKFSISSHMQCSWAAKDAGDKVRLSVKCEDQQARVTGGVTDLRCDYNGRPQRCEGYRSDPKSFWKQVSRAFKRLKDKTCRDDRALVRAGMCKRAPRDAHFKLDASSSVVSAQSGGDPETPALPPPPPPRSNSTEQACPGRAEQRRRAEEQCGSWASLCTFFFSMLQSEDC